MSGDAAGAWSFAGAGTGSAPVEGQSSGAGSGAWSFTGAGSGTAPLVEAPASGSGAGAFAFVGAGAGTAPASRVPRPQQLNLRTVRVSLIRTAPTASRITRSGDIT
jgi:hypothetical protein